MHNAFTSTLSKLGSHMSITFRASYLFKKKKQKKMRTNILKAPGDWELLTCWMKTSRVKDAPIPYVSNGSNFLFLSLSMLNLLLIPFLMSGVFVNAQNLRILKKNAICITCYRVRAFIFWPRVHQGHAVAQCEYGGDRRNTVSVAPS